MTDLLVNKLMAAFDRAAETAFGVRRKRSAGDRRSAPSASCWSAALCCPYSPSIAPVPPALPMRRKRKRPMLDCDYWRYCALDGFLCSCCGGSVSACPPGAEPSKVTWVGTCHNPKDGRSYLVSYNDCCGKTTCGRCLCNGNDGERPGYRMGVHNDINWCMANTQSMYHCTVSVLVGVADGK